MAGAAIIQDNKPRKKARQVKGSKAQMAKLKELKAVTKEIETRFKTSNKLFDKKQRLKEQLGIDL